MELDVALLILKRVDERIDSKATWASLENQEEIAEAIKIAFAYYHTRYVGLGMSGVKGAPDWQAYELKIWEVGESLRHFLKFKRWKGKTSLWMLRPKSCLTPSMVKAGKLSHFYLAVLAEVPMVRR